jgi:hypothetical protein
MGPGTRLRRNPDIIAADVSGETILLNPETWVYVHFNETAARIWECLDEPRRLDALVGTLVAEYQVNPSDCAHAIEEFVAGLSESGLLIVEDGA